jgi:hypothetical protein
MIPRLIDHRPRVRDPQAGDGEGQLFYLRGCLWSAHYFSSVKIAHVVQPVGSSSSFKAPATGITNRTKLLMSRRQSQ